MARYIFIITVGCLAVASGCTAGRNTMTGAALGTGLGAVTGAVIGHQTGHGGAGAAIGATTGALAGGLIGNAQDAREERDAAIAQARYQRDHTTAEMMSNADLVLMTQSGVGDDVIIAAIKARGGRFDLSPTAIVHLKNTGVSDRVILFVQAAQATGQATVPSTSYTYPPAPLTRVVIIPAHPPIYWGAVGPGRFGGPHRHWRR